MRSKLLLRCRAFMNEIHDDPKLVADQLGHTVDVNQNVYTRASIARRKTVWLATLSLLHWKGVAPVEIHPHPSSPASLFLFSVIHFDRFKHGRRPYY